jgi:ATP-dependent Clp protease adapter protein ClpS
MSERKQMQQADQTGQQKSAPSKPRQTVAPDKPKARQLPPWKVLLHNDDVNYAEDVVTQVCRLTPLAEHAAVQRVLEAHHAGVSLLLVTHKERAELYVEQFASCGLTVSIEPDE